ncbi:MAG: cytochrome d ubiquinol oxidase subunit II [Pirellulales bacterium]|nr:cytochrome d ubiquinol oxidase subunit II [Pirellulales bacterium]
MDLNTIWFLLIGVLMFAYAALDGFDLGVGVMHLFARSEEQRRTNMAAVGPVWDGNEVWLLTAGGALFAAFPIVYATTFSGFYLAFMLLLFALIFRAVSMEFRIQVDGVLWQRFWDLAFGLGSLVPALLFGVAVGNVLRGLPIDADGSLNVPFVELLNPYALLVGVLSLVMLLMQGAIYLASRTEGDLCRWAARWANGAWFAFVVVWIVSTIATFFTAPYLFEGILSKPLFWIVILSMLAGIVAVPLALRSQEYVWALLGSTMCIAALIGLMGVSMYPRMVPSSLDLANSLTIHNASSTPRTHTVMLIIALMGLPLVIAYTVFVYKVFMGKIDLNREHY